jgi:cyclic pyranopterin monophosphate synthase
VAQIAGIQSSKQTHLLIPLCHSLSLDYCDIKFITDDIKLQVKCESICKISNFKTGVEMEALTSCSIALLTIYDMIKAVQKDATINNIKLDYKYGGKSGDYVRNNDS